MGRLGHDSLNRKTLKLFLSLPTRRMVKTMRPMEMALLMKKILWFRILPAMWRTIPESMQRNRSFDRSGTHGKATVHPGAPTFEMGRFTIGVFWFPEKTGLSKTHPHTLYLLPEESRIAAHVLSCFLSSLPSWAKTSNRTTHTHTRRHKEMETPE